MSEEATLSIGALADAVGVGRETLRFYERRGLIPDPPRTRAGYRQYPPDTIRRVRFIRRAQELGFTLSEISELLDLQISDPSACGLVESNARAKLHQVETKIEDLRRIGAALKSLVAQCQAREATGDCPILEELEDREGPVV